jgi:hypothetical protein
MDNKEFFEKLKFGVGDGNLHYYIYNWQCPQINPEKVFLFNQILCFLFIYRIFILDRIITPIEKQKYNFF